MCSWSYKLQVSIGLGDALVSKKWKAITRTTVDQDAWRHVALLRPQYIQFASNREALTTISKTGAYTLRIIVDMIIAIPAVTQLP